MKKQLTKKRKQQFRIILFLLPIVILVILEFGLRVFGYGARTHMFFRPNYMPSLYLENLAVYNNYQDREHQIESVRTEDHIRNLMQRKKPEGTIRGFVVGGSAAQSFPYNSNMGFSKMIEAALLTTGKYTDAEVLNFGVSAISSYSVRDISKKLLKYDPDFLIVYAGNNEYYGTFSYSTGGNHFSRNLYMQLKNLSLFQFVKDIVLFFGQNQPGDVMKANVMKNRFNEMTFTKNEDIDQQIALNYLKNVKALTEKYHKKKIPVILASPVSNILDLAPFGSQNNEDVYNYASKIYNQIKKKNLTVAEDALKVLLNERNIEDNANLMYLQAVLDEATTGRPDLDQFIQAKDQDMIPFRPRSILIEKLDSFSQAHATLTNLHFIHTANELIGLYGDTILSNDIFIDHVHFNQYGHKIMAELFTKQLTHILELDNPEKDRINQFFNNDSLVYQSVYSLPMYRLFANKIVSRLVSQPPFIGMSIPYKPNAAEMSQAVEAMGMDLAQKTLPMGMNESFSNTVVYYLNKGDLKTAEQYFQANRFMFPGTYHNYLNLGRYYHQHAKDLSRAEENYLQAYLLSEKKRDIYNEIKQFYAKFNMSDKAQQFDKKYGL